MLFWLMGDAGEASAPLPTLLILAVGLIVALFFARELNLLTRGPVLAATLGVNVAQLRLVLYFLASLLTATAVTSVGSVGFVGLVVPHLVRLLLGNDQRLLLPAATLAGAALLTLADTLARTLIAPQQLPVGVLTALIGVPVFLFLLARAPRVEQS
jgi:iron complex transport system permease protein